MFAELLLATVFQIGPFWQERADRTALCPVWSTARAGADETTDVLWPVFTAHRDWWRFCWVVHAQREIGTAAGQFEIIPLWFSGQDRDGESYRGLFPIWGRHPHILMLEDWRFCLWPIWMRYQTPRPSEQRRMETTAVLFPFLHWRDDGSWGFWPFCGYGKRRESDHSYVLWPLATWADYRADRDTAGAGRSWMLWPIWADVSRERESQRMFLPPFFSFAETRSPDWSARGDSCPGLLVRCPWPFFEFERTLTRERLSLFPLYEREETRTRLAGVPDGGVTRFGWRLVELYENAAAQIEETRVFPFWLQNKTHVRLWPLWSETATDAAGEVRVRRSLDLLPIRWAASVDRNWAPYWTFYESVSNPVYTDHSLLWGIFSWRTFND
jgi:hypothetical protein